MFLNRTCWIFLFLIAISFLPPSHAVVQQPDKMGNLTVMVYDKSGTSAQNAIVYWGDTVLPEYEGIDRSDAEGKIHLTNLTAGYNYMFWTFIDGYMINKEIKNLSRGNDTILRLEPDTIGPQSAIQINISIHEHEEVNWRIEVQNCSPGDYLYVDVLM